MARRLIFLLPALVFVVIAAYFLWGLNPERDPRLIPSAMISKEIPSFELAAVAGTGVEGFSDSDLRQGKVVLVNIFASWCLPCRVEHKYLVQLVEEQGVELYGINYKDDPKDAADWLAELGNPYTRIGADPGRAAIDWGVYGVPETFVVDGLGRIRYHHRGPVFPEILESDILPIIRAVRS